MAPAFAGFKLKSTGRLDALKAGGRGDILKSPSCPASFFNGPVELKANTKETTKTSEEDPSTKVSHVAVNNNSNDHRNSSSNDNVENKDPTTSHSKGLSQPSSAEVNLKNTTGQKAEVVNKAGGEDATKTIDSNTTAKKDIVRTSPVVQVTSTPTRKPKPPPRKASPSIQIEVTSTPVAKKAPPRHSKSLPVPSKKSPPKRTGSNIIVVVESTDEAPSFEYQVGEAAPKKEKEDKNGLPDLEEDELRKLNKKNKLVGGSLINGICSCDRCDSDRIHSKPVTVTREGKDYAAHLNQCLDCGRQFHK